MKINIPGNHQFKEQWARGLLTLKGLLQQSVPQPEAAPGLLGVDIGTDSVKICRLDFDKQSLVLTGYCTEKIEEKKITDAVARCMKKCTCADDLCVLSLSGQGVVSRYVELPLMNKSELESSMKFEIEKYVPFPLAEVATDYAVAGEMKEKAKLNILIAAAKNELVQRKCTLARELNLKVKALDLDSLALANFYTDIVGKQNIPACCAVIHMGRTNCNMDILVEGHPFLSRDIFIGGDDLTKKIAESMEVELSEAEVLKCSPGQKQESLETAVEPVFNSLASEIRVSLDYFESRGNRAVEKVFISGGTSRMMGLQGYLKHALALDVEKVDYADRVKLSSSVNAEAFRADSDLLTVALGLSLRTEK